MDNILKIIPLTKEYAIDNSDNILKLERNWIEIGDIPWNLENLLYDLPMKWDLSYVSKFNNQFIGYQIASKQRDNVFLHKIIVDQSVRGIGVGKKLLYELLKKSTEYGFEKINFKVRLDNKAYGFYDKLGFKKLDEIDHSRPDGIKCYYYDTVIKDVMGNFSF